MFKIIIISVFIMVILVILVTGIRWPTSGSLPDSQLSAELPMPGDHDDDQEEGDDDVDDVRDDFCEDGKR